MFLKTRIGIYWLLFVCVIVTGTIAVNGQSIKINNQQESSQIEPEPNPEESETEKPEILPTTLNIESPPPDVNNNDENDDAVILKIGKKKNDDVRNTKIVLPVELKTKSPSIKNLSNDKPDNTTPNSKKKDNLRKNQHIVKNPSQTKKLQNSNKKIEETVASTEIDKTTIKPVVLPAIVPPKRPRVHSNEETDEQEPRYPLSSIAANINEVKNNEASKKPTATKATIKKTDDAGIDSSKTQQEIEKSDDNIVESNESTEDSSLEDSELVSTTKQPKLPPLLKPQTKQKLSETKPSKSQTSKMSPSKPQIKQRLPGKRKPQPKLTNKTPSKTPYISALPKANWTTPQKKQSKPTAKSHVNSGKKSLPPPHKPLSKPKTPTKQQLNPKSTSTPKESKPVVPLHHAEVVLDSQDKHEQQRTSFNPSTQMPVKSTTALKNIKPQKQEESKAEQSENDTPSKNVDTIPSTIIENSKKAERYAAPPPKSSGTPLLVTISLGVITTTVLFVILGVYYRHLTSHNRRYGEHMPLMNTDDDELSIFARNAQAYNVDALPYTSWRDIDLPK